MMEVGQMRGVASSRPRGPSCSGEGGRRRCPSQRGKQAQRGEGAHRDHPACAQGHSWDPYQNLTARALWLCPDGGTGQPWSICRHLGEEQLLQVLGGLSEKWG